MPWEEILWISCGSTSRLLVLGFGQGEASPGQGRNAVAVVPVGLAHGAGALAVAVGHAAGAGALAIEPVEPVAARLLLGLRLGQGVGGVLRQRLGKVEPVGPAHLPDRTAITLQLDLLDLVQGQSGFFILALALLLFFEYHDLLIGGF